MSPVFCHYDTNRIFRKPILFVYLPLPQIGWDAMVEKEYDEEVFYCVVREN